MSNIPNDIRYAKTHEWVKQISDDIVQIGISDFAQQELGDLVFVELPEVGRQVSAAEQCAVVESVKTASDLYSPVSGVVTEVNRRLEDEPGLINEDAYANWLFTIKMDNATELEQLLDAADYQAHLDE